MKDGTCDPPLEEGGCKGATPKHSIPEPVIEGAQAGTPNVELAGIHPPLVARHLPPHTSLNHNAQNGKERKEYGSLWNGLAMPHAHVLQERGDVSKRKEYAAGYHSREARDQHKLPFVSRQY